MTRVEPTKHAPLMLSVSGVRGIVGQTMTPSVAVEFAAAFGTHVRRVSGKRQPLVCVGRDSRPSGEMLMAAVTAGLSTVGCRVITLGIVPTPTVSVMIGRHEADGGMVVTASHNPIAWNGIKCLDGRGFAPPRAEADRIIRRFRSGRIDVVPTADLAVTDHDAAAAEWHRDRVLAHVDAAPVRAAALPVVLDAVNGAGGRAGRLLLESLGCRTVVINGEPTGRFARGPEPTADHVGELAARTAEVGAACGFAQDPDADRLAIVDETGRYIGEESTLVLAARRLLDLHGGGVIVANLSTSRMIDDLAAAYSGAEVRRTPVGEANVAAAMSTCGALVGGEGNGGVIYPQVCWVRDSLSAMALVLGLMAAEGRPLSVIVDGLPRYSMIKRKMPLGDLGEAWQRGIDHVAGAFPEADIDRADGVRVDFAEGWVHLRASNTEPIVRLIAEARTEAETAALADRVAAAAGLG